MAARAIVRLGDPTSHGGEVLEAFQNISIYGKPAAGVGHKGYCPKCKREFVIIGGAAIATYLGKNVAVEGMYTSCDATLIATQGQATIDIAPGSENLNSSFIQNNPYISALTTLFNEKFQLVDDETGHPLINVEYAVIRASGEIEHGRTDERGYTHLLSSTAEAEDVQIFV